MKKTLFFALALVSTLTCIAPASAKVIEHSKPSSRNTEFIDNNNTQYFNRAVQPKNKYDGMVASVPTNQSVTAAKPAYRGKPGNPTPAGRR